MPDHNDPNLTVTKLVRNRLTFLTAVVDENDPTDSGVVIDKLISNYALEVFHEMEDCFKASSITLNGDEVDPADLARVGVEENYGFIQKSLVSDIISMYILMQVSAANAGASSSEDGGTSQSTFMSKAKAGSVEVEWDQFDSKAASNFLSAGTDTLKEHYMKAANRKAKKLGCIFEICDDCTTLTTQTETAGETLSIPFVVGGCGTC